MLLRNWLLAAAFCLPAISVHGQVRYRAEVFGSLGSATYAVISLVPSSESSTALNVGTGVGLRPFSVERSPYLRMIGAEFEANFTRNLSPSAPMQGYFTGNAVLHFSNSRIQPYLVLGAGASHQAPETHRAADVGAGVKLFISPHVSLRPEFRAFATKYLGNFARLSVGLGYHW